MFTYRKSNAECYVAVPSDEATADSRDGEAVVVRRPSAIRRFTRSLLAVLTCLSLLFVAVGWWILIHRPYNSDALRHRVCTHPPARQEWRTLSDEHKHEYIDAVKCLHETPSTLRERRGLGDAGRFTDDFPWVHIEMSGTTHYTHTFLLWHRYFIWLYESALRERCGYNGVLPFWDWSLDWQDPPGSPVWSAETGFGGDGDKSGNATSNGGSCVRDGPFANYEVYYANQEPRPHCLSRNFNFAGRAFAPDVLEAIYDKHASLADFSINLERKSHDSIPQGIGGDFALFTAPSDPIWFLHHSNIDRLFQLWQDRDPQRRANYLGLREESEEVRQSLDSRMPMYGLAEDLRYREVLDSQAGLLCYTYTHTSVY